MIVDPKLSGGRSDKDPDDGIDQTVQQFEVAWQQQQGTRLEEYLRDAGGDRSVLFPKLLRVELAYRRRFGERPSESEYCERFPEEAEAVHEVFAAEISMAGTGRLSGETQVPSSIPAPQNPTISARFNNLRFHASGGLGDVYRATDESLRRDVALKFTQQRHGGNPDYLELFFLEAEVTSRLDHPGVVPVYGLGESACGRPFYAMRFIEGIQLKSAIETFHKNGACHLELHHLLTHIVAVCNTLAYAHNRGIVHRDIKPDNIMLGKFGETLLVDWGLAMSVQRDDRARASGEKTMLLPGSGSGSGRSSGIGAGTVGYMSPEQLPDHSTPITPASDIYSLGATLYRLLTNHAPIEGQGETLLLDKIRWGDFPRPSELNHNVPEALEAICLKAMATDPSARYRSALDLAADLEAWMADEEVSVYREPSFERLFRWGRRHRNWAIFGTMAVVMVLLVTSGWALHSRSAAALETRARIEAEEARSMAEAARGEAEQAKQNGMRVAARFAGKAVANEIDLRWRVLTLEAASPELRQLMIAVAGKSLGSTEQQALQQWLEDRRKANTIEAESWFVTDHRGIQVAREPFSRKTIYEDYSRRTYFHGGPREFDPKEMPDVVKPITGVNLSTVYLSTTSGTLKVSFSVPIWKDNESLGECLGVLGMSLALGSFRELQTGLHAGQIAVLVDTREDQIEGEPRSGLILHHAQLQQAQQRRLAAGDESFFRVSPARVEQLQRLRKLRSREAGIIAQPATDSAASSAERIDLAGSIATDYVDPLAPNGSPAVAAAFEPVRIESRPPEARDTGWIVVVQEDPEQAEQVKPEQVKPEQVKPEQVKPTLP
jgi:hypothetical protein